VPRPRVNVPGPPESVRSIADRPAAALRGGWDRWLSLSIYTRRRICAIGGVAAAIALILVVAIPALPCGAPGGGSCAPTDHAIGLIPADALAYAHFDADPETDQYAKATAIAAQVPTLTQQVTGRLLGDLPAPHPGPVDFAADVGPWFGGEAALAILPAGGRAAQEVQLLQVGDQEGAAAFARAVASGSLRTVTYRAVPVQIDSRGLATAVLGGFLVIGAQDGVHQVIDARTGATRALVDDAAAGSVRAGLPGERLADLYLSKDGIARLVAKPGAPFSILAPVVDPGASRGATAALVAGDDGLDVQVRSSLDPDLSSSHPSAFSAFSSFEPSLPSSLSADSLGYLGIGSPGSAIAALAAQASAAGSGLASSVAKLLGGVKALGKVDLKGLLATLGDQAALALEPASPSTAGGRQAGNASVPSAGGRSSPQTPILTFVAPAIDTATAAKALADLERPVSKALGGSGFSAHAAQGTKIRSVRVSPAIDLTYAIVDSLLVIATQPDGLAAVSSGGPVLAEADLFRQATADLPGEVSMLGYLNLDGLIALGESAGLASDPAYATFAPEIQRLQALGVAVQSTPSELSTDARLVIGTDSGTTSATGTPSD
jgi:uncharacterized protein DUF3352